MIDGITLHGGDCRDVLPKLEENSIDSCVTDPPYGLSFMGRGWDHGVPGVEFWREVYRVLKPGAHLVAFGGTRTYHRMACAIEDAGFEIRDSLMWVYGVGFPKSHDVSKGIDKAAGAKREILKTRKVAVGFDVDRQGGGGWSAGEVVITAPATDAAREWQGWGTALKPAFENITFATKPYDLSHICDKLAPIILEALCQLPSFARHADRNSLLSQSVFVMGDEQDSVQWNAVLACNTPADLFALMDMWPSDLGIPSSLSIALSWLSILAGVCKHSSTFTTEMKSSLTTDLKILNSLASTITPSTIIEAATIQNGTALNASPVAHIFNAVESKLNCIHALSVVENATSPLATHSQGGGVRSEPIVLARKPLSESTVAANVLRWGTGALNIDGCRIESERTTGWGGAGAGGNTWTAENNGLGKDGEARPVDGRWPANVVHDGSAEVVAMFPYNNTKPRDPRRIIKGDSGADAQGNTSSAYGVESRKSGSDVGLDRGDSGSAARFFYSAKASKADRAGSKHPTVKPIDLKRWLARLITPPGGTVLDPFAGSGTTGAACRLEGFSAVLIEREAEYQQDIRNRFAGLPEAAE